MMQRKSSPQILICIVLFSLTPGSGLLANINSASIVINEFLASNATINADEAGDYSDWIELYNTGQTAVDLKNYTLTDNPSMPEKWTFPSVVLNPGEYLLIWASGKDLATDGDLHSNFKLDADGEFVGLYDPFSIVVDSTYFCEQFVDVSMARIPNGTGDFEHTNNPTPSDFNRRNDSQLNSLTLVSPNGGESWLSGSIRYIEWEWTGFIQKVRLEYSTNSGSSWVVIDDTTANDGSKKWIVPPDLSTFYLLKIIALDDEAVSDVSDASFSVIGQSPHYNQIKINEFLALNDSLFADEDGDFEDWIEIFNTGLSAVDLAGYSLTENAENPYKWQFSSVVLEPQRFLLVWASGKNRSTDSTIHTNFRLNSAGEYLGLYDPAGAVLDSLTYQTQLPNISMARLPDGDGDFLTTNQPTPGQSNSANVPVELSFFKIKLIRNNEVLLVWRTDSESNNYGFEIQRKSLNSNFETVGFIKGQNTTSIPTLYSFQDKSEEYGFYYYRLKQIDIDGSVEYSYELQVQFSAPQTFTIESNYPNPFNSSTTLIFSIYQKTEVEIKIFNTMGELINHLLKKEMEPGEHRIVWNGANNNGVFVPSGIYYIEFKAGKQSKLIKTLCIK